MSFRRYVPHWWSFICLIIFQAAWAVDEDTPHPIDERGLLSWVAINTTRLFRNVEIVEIRDYTVKRPDITINPGTVVVLENQDDRTNHRVIFPPAPGNDITMDVSSSVIKPGELWGAEFLTAGVYPFHCTLHPDQVLGVVRVEEPADR